MSRNEMFETGSWKSTLSPPRKSCSSKSRYLIRCDFLPSFPGNQFETKKIKVNIPGGTIFKTRGDLHMLRATSRRRKRSKKPIPIITWVKKFSSVQFSEKPYVILELPLHITASRIQVSQKSLLVIYTCMYQITSHNYAPEMIQKSESCLTNSHRKLCAESQSFEGTRTRHSISWPTRG